MELGALSLSGTEAFAVNGLLCNVQCDNVGEAARTGCWCHRAHTSMAGKVNKRWDVLDQASVAQRWVENRINGSSEEHSSLSCPGE